MNILNKTFSIIMLIALPIIGAGTASAADDKAIIQTFYDLLSNPGSAAAAKKFRQTYS